MNADGYSAFKNFCSITLVSTPKLEEILFAPFKSLSFIAFRFYLFGTRDDQREFDFLSDNDSCYPIVSVSDLCIKKHFRAYFASEFNVRMILI